MLDVRIKELRRDRGWTQRDLANKMNVSQQTIGSWEVGRAEPNAEALTKLSELFEVSIDYLLGKKHTPKWASNDQVIELDKILESDAGMAYGNIGEVTKEDREQINDLIASYFWRKKQKQEKNNQ